jgi:hypothetical protein
MFLKKPHDQKSVAFFPIDNLYMIVCPASVDSPKTELCQNDYSVDVSSQTRETVCLKHSDTKARSMYYLLQHYLTSMTIVGCSYSCCNNNLRGMNGTDVPDQLAQCRFVYLFWFSSAR